MIATYSRTCLHWCMAAGILTLPLLVGADTYEPLTDIPGFEAANNAGSFTELINVIYKVAIALSIAVAVVVLVVEGVRYSASDIPGVKADIKNRIPLVIGGMVLLIAAYMLLELINPQLVNLEDLTGTGTVPDNSGLGTVGEATDPREFDGVTYESGKTGEEVMQEINELSWAEIQQLANNNGSNNVGIELEGGGTIAEGDYDATGSVRVTEDGQEVVAAAITTCSGIPESWASDSDLYKLIAKESSGQVGILNHKLDDYREQAGLSYSRIASDIRSNTFYYQHCCSVTKQSTREAREGGFPYTCNPATQSPFIESAGNCFSSAGIGQLTVENMSYYQPSGVRGFGSAREEICGMLKYVDDRYGSPGAALQFHLENNYY